VPALPAVQAPPSAPATFTLPLAIPLAVTVKTGPGGAIADVTVDPNSITQLAARPGKVAFTNNADGVKVTVKSKGQQQSVSARGGSLADFANPAGGGWSGDVFGDGTKWAVPFTVSGTDAAPVIAVGAVTGGTFTVGTLEVSAGDDDDSNEVSARIGVTFTDKTATLTRTLTIRVKTETGAESDDDDDSSSPSASLSVSLGKIRGLPQDAATAVGTHTWTGALCDNSLATITYTVAADGSIDPATVVASPTAEVKAEEGKLSVKFSTGERIRLKVSFDGTKYTINVDAKIRCRDAAAPTINGAPATVTTDAQSGDHHDGDHHGGGGNGGGSGGHGGDGNQDD
jgi:hypothetical protein